MPATHDYAGIAANSFVKTVGDTEIHSYDDARQFLGKEKERVIASNVTVVRLSRTSIGIRLYSTFILTYHSDGTFEGDNCNGAFATPTTSSRCNQFGPKGYFFGHRNRKLYARGLLMKKGLRYKIEERDDS